jgi:hypothetical protein
VGPTKIQNKNAPLWRDPAISFMAADADPNMSSLKKKIPV